VLRGGLVEKLGLVQEKGEQFQYQKLGKLQRGGRIGGRMGVGRRLLVQSHIRMGIFFLGLVWFVRL